MHRPCQDISQGMHTVVPPLLCLSIHLLYCQQDFSHHIPPVHMLSYGQVVLSSEYKERVLKSHQICPFNMNCSKVQKASECPARWCLHISFWWCSPQGRRQHERELPNNSQVWMTTGVLDWARDSWALAFSGMRCRNNFFHDSVLFKNENCYFIFLKLSLLFWCFTVFCSNQLWTLSLKGF